YISSRLLRVLEEGGCAVRCLARQPERVAFAHRHRVVRAAIGLARPRAAARWAAAAALVAATTLQPAVGQAQMAAPVRTVPFVDLDRYLGDWFEIARFPNRF